MAKKKRKRKVKVLKEPVKYEETSKFDALDRAMRSNRGIFLG